MATFMYTDVLLLFMYDMAINFNVLVIVRYPHMCYGNDYLLYGYEYIVIILFVVIALNQRSIVRCLHM